MEFGGNNKLKVVWICHFSNKEIQSLLPLKKKIEEFAPWISLGIKEVIKSSIIELHVISPHKFLNRQVDIEKDNIFYHFYNSGIPFYGRHWPAFFRFDVLSNFYGNKKVISKIVNKLNPDIIHLHGAENAYYSSSILRLYKKYPVLVTIQGFITRSSNNKDSIYTKRRVCVEKEILKKLNNFGIRNSEMRNHIIKYNPNAVFHYHEYFLNREKEVRRTEDIKNFDLIFFARINKDKGIEDLIKITGILKIKNPLIKVAVIGTSSNEYMSYLQDQCKECNCEENVFFLGYLKTQADVFKVLSQSKISVLPTYNDIIPGTIIESMFRNIPVVTYNTGGIPEINDTEKRIEIIEQGKWIKMAEVIENLLFDSIEREKLAKKAKEYADNRWNNKQAMTDIISIYETILSQNK